MVNFCKIIYICFNSKPRSFNFSCFSFLNEGGAALFSLLLPHKTYSPSQEVQEVQAEPLLPQAETHHERSQRILEEEEIQRKKELERRTALKRKERERETEIEQ